MNWPWKNKYKHEYEFVRNIYGDQINQHNGMRSKWRCKKCGKIEYRKYLQTTTIAEKLDKLYDKYYEDKYEKWCEDNKDTLNHMISEMIERAKKGLCWVEFILACDEEKNDKNYYEKWFKHNNLNIEVTLQGEEKCFKLNAYKFNVRWKNN